MDSDFILNAYLHINRNIMNKTKQTKKVIVNCLQALGCSKLKYTKNKNTNCVIFQCLHKDVWSTTTPLPKVNVDTL